jgi:small subunit ribosomal protein S6
LKDYECVVIFTPAVAGDALTGATKKYVDVITTQGGEIKEIDDWGKRSLAYEIDFHREGHYLFYRFKGGNNVLNELTRQLRIDENVIRHMIVRDDLRGRSHYKPTAETPEIRPVHAEDTEEDV